jgi:hypothetical protein
MRACCLQRALTELIDGNFSLEVFLKRFLQGSFDPEFSAPLKEKGDGGDDDYRPTNCAERHSSFHGPRSRLVHRRTRPAGRLGVVPTEPTLSRPANRPHGRSPHHPEPLTRPRRGGARHRRAPSSTAPPHKLDGETNGSLGGPSHLRALFGDVDLHTLRRKREHVRDRRRGARARLSRRKAHDHGGPRRARRIRRAVQPLTLPAQPNVVTKRPSAASTARIAATASHLNFDSSGAIILSNRPGMGYEPILDALADT